MAVPLWTGLALLGILTACAPTTVSPASVGVARPDAGLGAAPGLRAAFSDAGVAWVTGGRACVARAPTFLPNCPPLPPTVDVGWHDAQAWAGVPSLGAAVTLDGLPRSVTVGRVSVMSAERIYRENGSAVTYAGAAAPGVLGQPAAALTGGDGLDYLLLDGRVVRSTDGAALAGSGFTLLNWQPGGVAGGTSPQVVAATGTYRLTGTHLERLDAAGVVRARVAHAPGRVGVVGQWIVTVEAAGMVRVFGPDLSTR